MSTEAKIREILEDKLTAARCGRYIIINRENPIAPSTPRGVPLMVIGEGVGSRHITYKTVHGWSEIGEDDRYLILQVPTESDDVRKSLGSSSVWCYAMRYDHWHGVILEADESLLDSICEEIAYECDDDDDGCW